VPTTALNICQDALFEIGVLAPGESLQAADGAFALGKLNRLIDNWNAERAAVYSDQFEAYTLVPSLAPHTIGPTGATFTVTQRPVTIEGASVILDNVTPAVYVPIAVRDAAWWDAQTVPDLTAEFPTDVYYEPAWPNGKLWFWPVPTTAYGVNLMTRIVLAELTLASSFSLPPGYKDAITLTLAEDLASPYGAQISQITREKARDARARRR
jgi:hypothetical protein